MKTKVLKYITFWRAVLAIILAFGAYAVIIRYTKGLGASTNLDDQFPWGLWISFDVLCGVGLAAGGFVVMATVHLFNIQKYRPIIRPTVLTAFMGYCLVIVALLIDLGRPYRIWHAFVMWNPRSVMFEVAWCVILYTAVLALEFSPIFFEKFGWKKAIHAFHVVSIPLVITGVILSMLHQSSLGSLYLIVPEKLYPLWYSPLLPFFFFISAVAVGLAMTIFESFMSLRAFGKHLEMDLLAGMAKAMVVVLAVYATLKAVDFNSRHAWKFVFTPNKEAYFFWLEITVGVLLPMILLANEKVRTHRQGLFYSAIMVILGFVINRMNVSITGWEGASRNYFPHWMEWAVTMSIIGVAFLLFALAVRYLPIFNKDELEEKSALERFPYLESQTKLEPKAIAN